MERTPKKVIWLRMMWLPIIKWIFIMFVMSIGGFSAFLPAFFGGLTAIGGVTIALWGGVNFLFWLFRPEEYRIWKAGGGDPFFDSTSSLFNSDPPEIRYQEFYQEQAKRDLKRMFGVDMDEEARQCQQATVPQDDLSIDNWVM